jgi:DNA mismatch endonuclease (patch repair protein)
MPKKGYKRTPEHQANLTAALRGRRLSESHKKNISKVQKGKILSAYSRDKLSRARMGVKSPLRGRTLSDDVKYKISESLKRAYAEGRVSKKATYRSDAEVAFFDKLKKVLPDCVPQYTLPNGKHPFDIYVPSINTLIEFDGCFWHACPDHFPLAGNYSSVKKSLMNSSLAEDVAKAAGYKVLRIWEHEDQDLFIAKIVGKSMGGRR